MDGLDVSHNGGAPTAKVGLTAITGNRQDFMRADGAPALDQGITPTWTALHTFNAGISIAGSVTAVSFALSNGATITDTGTGALALTASGTNQNITLAPSGTGNTYLSRTPPGNAWANVAVANGAGWTGAFSYSANQLLIVDQTNAYNANPLSGIGFVGARNSGTYDSQFAAIYGGKENATAANNQGFLDFYTTTSATTPTRAIRINSAGSILLGTTTDSSNGRLQLATHTTSAGGIGFGTDWTVHRETGPSFAIAHNTLAANATYLADIISDSTAAAPGIGIRLLTQSATGGGRSWALVGNNTNAGDFQILHSTTAAGAPATVIATFNNAGDFNVASTTASSSTATGSATFGGGIGVAGAIYAGGTGNFTGTLTVGGALTAAAQFAVGTLDSRVSGKIAGTVTASSNYAAGIEGSATLTAAATGDNLYGYYQTGGMTVAKGAFTVSSYTGIRIDAPAVSGAGPIANHTGLNIGNVALGTGNNFAITTGTGWIQFGDRVGIMGAPRSDAALNMVGTLNTSSGAGYCAVFNNTITAQANSDAAAVLRVAGTLATGTYTGLTHYGAYISGPTLTGSGSLTESTLLRLGSAASATNKYGIYQVGTDLNYFGGSVQVMGTFGLGSAPTAYWATNIAPSMANNGGNTSVEINPTWAMQASGNYAIGLAIDGTLNRGTGLTGLSYYAININAPSLSGSSTLGTATMLNIAAAPAATTKYGIYQAGTDQNYLNGQLVAKGTATNDSAPAGFIGEYVESIITTGSEVSLTTGVPANLTSISLTAGDWDVTGSVFLDLNAATVLANALFGFNTTSATPPAIDSSKRAHFTWNSTNNWVGTPSATMPTCRFSLSTTTTIYFVCYANFSTNTLAVFGSMRARRVR